MADQQLVDYISGNVRRGARMGDVRKILLDQGWTITEVDEAVAVVRGPPMASMPVPPPPQPARDVFRSVQQASQTQTTTQKMPKAGMAQGLMGAAGAIERFRMPFILSLIGGAAALAAAVMNFMAGTAFISVPLIDGIFLNSIFGMSSATIVMTCAAMLLMNSRPSTGLTAAAFSVIMVLTASDVVMKAGAIASAAGGFLPSVGRIAVVMRRKRPSPAAA
jgi:hypothetical protein